MQIRFGEVVGAGIACAAIGLLAGDGLLALSVLVLLVGLKLVWTSDGLFVLPAAFAFHWLETSIGLVYRAVFDREVATFHASNYQPMVLIALGCCLALAAGIRLGMSVMDRMPASEPRIRYAFSFNLLAVAYVLATCFEGTLVVVAADYPSVRQIIVTADSARLGLLFLLLRRLLWPTPRWMTVAGILGVEVVLGISGFFAGFREPLVLGTLAILEIFDRRNMRHWAAITTAAVAASAIGLLWMGIRGEYRRNYIELDNFAKSRSMRLQDLQILSLDFLKADSESTWNTADTLVERMWTVYYPALAVERIPSQVPHTNGEILSAALVHIVTPRVFFPGKPELQSDSEKVRKFSGVFVAGAEQNTSIAFGYAAEAYVDFGVPMMFLPVVCFGLAIGMLYTLFDRLLHHRELLFAFSTVAFWMSVYLFERSWATMLGTSLGMMVYLGVPVFLLDRFLLIGWEKQRREQQPLLYSDQHPSGAM
jgi:hypothetical protein